MDISSEQIILIIKIILIVVIIAFLIKKAIKIALALIAILIIFQVGFMMTGTDLNERLHLDKYLKPDTNKAVTSFFDDFRSRGNNIAVVDQDAVYDGMVDGMEQGVNFIVEKLSDIQIEALAETIARNIYEVGAESIDEEELAESLERQLENVDPEDIDKVVTTIIGYWNQLKDNNGKIPETTKKPSNPTP